MKKIIIFCLVLFTCFALKAQNQSDSIQIEMKFGTNYIYQGKKLNPRQLLNVMEVNPEAYDVMKKAKRNYDAAQVFSFIGGALIGYPIGTAIGGGDPNWLLAGIGVGVVGVAIPFSIAFNKNARSAVALYNEGLRTLGHQNVEMKLGMSANGVGLTVTF